jgi:uncharacterized protein YjiS (DUF1127 family)
MSRLIPRMPGFRRASDAREPPQREEARPQPLRRSLPPVGQLRRERRALLSLREDRLRDLGGLMLEMFRRDRFRQDLILERCTELVAIEDRLGELEAHLGTALSHGRERPAARCECGAPIFWGSRFCAQCGRAVALTG